MRDPRRPSSSSPRRRSSWLRALAACALTAAGVRAAPAVETASPEDDARVRAELSALVAGWRGEGSPGGVLGVLRDGEPWILEAFGSADLAAREPCTPETPFYLASAAKQFAAACVADAAREGRLSLDDPVAKHVAGLPEALGAVTLRHLMHQRSGVKDVYELAVVLDLGREAIASNAAAVALLSELPELDFAPGERFAYSNSNYVLLAEALRGATGKALPEHARERLFTPLAMAGAAFGEPAPGARQRARSYRRTDGGWRPQEVSTGLVGPGGMWASFADLARWDRAWARGELGDAALRAVLLAPPELAPGRTHHPTFGPYAAGLMVGQHRGLAAVRHAGGAFGFSAELLRFPGAGVSVVALSNASDLDARSLAERAAEVVLRGRFPQPAPEAAPLAPAEIAELGRLWVDEASGLAWILTATPERTLVATLGDLKLALARRGPRELATVGGHAELQLRFEPAEGAPTRLVVRDGATTIATCRRLPFPPRDLPPAKEYEGEYELAAIGARVRLRADGERLTIVQQRALQPFPPFVLPPFQAIGEERFLCDAGFQLSFARDGEGRVRSVRLDANRARGLVLERR